MIKEENMQEVVQRLKLKVKRLKEENRALAEAVKEANNQREASQAREG